MSPRKIYKVVYVDFPEKELQDFSERELQDFPEKELHEFSASV